jgi:hypothetical protein
MVNNELLERFKFVRHRLLSAISAWETTYDDQIQSKNPPSYSILYRELIYFYELGEKIENFLPLDAVEDTLLHYASFLESVLKGIKSFNTPGGEISDINSIIQGFNFDGIRKKIEEDIPKLTYLIDSNELDGLVEESKSQIQELKKNQKEIESIFESAKEIGQEIKATSESVKETVQNTIRPEIEKAAAIIGSRDFEKSATKNLATKELYGKLIIAWLILLLIYIIYLGNNFCFEFKCMYNCCLIDFESKLKSAGNKILNYEIGKAIFYRLLIVSIGLIILRFLISNFRAAAHNEIINNHRADALAAGFLLMDKAGGEASHEISALVANAIFAHQPTGYNNKEPENIVNAIEKVAGKFTDKL